LSAPGPVVGHWDRSRLEQVITNMITTGAMTRLGYVYENLMVDLKASNIKLVDRSIRIIMMVTGLPRDRAEDALQKAGGHVKLAIVMQKKGVSRDEAEKLLADNGGVVRRVTKDAPPPIKSA